MKLKEHSSYLSGLIEGYDTKEHQIIKEMAKVIEELTEQVEVLQSRVDDLTSLCDDLDKDLGEVEEDLYGSDSYDAVVEENHDNGSADESVKSDDEKEYKTDLEEEPEEIDSDEAVSDEKVKVDDYEKVYDKNDSTDKTEENISSEMYEVECPTCGHMIQVNDETLSEGQMECPYCGEVLSFDFDDVKLDDEENKDN